MKQLWLALKWFLIVWGAMWLVIVPVAVSSFLRGGAKESKATASKQDVRFVLNWCRLGDARIEEVLHSYVSRLPFSGDYSEIHAIRITHVSVSELKPDEDGAGWFRCDQAQGILAEAIDSVLGGDEERSWFPSHDQLKSADFYVFPWSIQCHGIRPTGIQLIFVRPADRMVFYVGGQS